MGSAPSAPFLLALRPLAGSSIVPAREPCSSNPSERPLNAPVLWDSPPLVHNRATAGLHLWVPRGDSAFRMKWNPYGWAQLGFQIEAGGRPLLVEASCPQAWPDELTSGRAFP
jgi:hypothetical protein